MYGEGVPLYTPHVHVYPFEIFKDGVGAYNTQNQY